MAFDHVHASVRVRKVPALVVWLAFKVGLGRLVVESRTLPHHADCTAETAVLEGEG